MQTKNILLVDDNELLLSGMKRFFEKDFAHVTTCITGEDAIKQIQNHPYQAIILDINLPGIDGWTVLDYIKQNLPNSKVVIITSNEDVGIRQDAIQRGACECMGKPFNLDELKCVVMNIISMQQRYQRVMKTFPVRFGSDCRGLVHNLSSTGMYIQTDIFCESGTTLNIILDVTNEKAIHLKGQVVRTVELPAKVAQPVSIAEHIKTVPPVSDERKMQKGMNFGLGIKILDQPQVYSSLISSLQV